MNRAAQLVAALAVTLALVGCLVSDELAEDFGPLPTAATPPASTPTVAPITEDRPAQDVEREPYQLADFDCSQTERWVDGVDVLLFFNPDAPESFIADVESELEAQGFIERIRFIDKEEAFVEFQEMFADTAIEGTVSAADVTPRLDIWITEPIEDRVATLDALYGDNPHIFGVVAEPPYCYPFDIDMEVLCTDLGLPLMSQTIVYFAPDTPQAEIERVGERLQSSGLFGEIVAIDQAQAYEDFRALGIETDVSNLGIEASDMPPSFELDVPSPALAQSLLDELENHPAIFDIIASSPRCELPGT